MHFTVERRTPKGSGGELQLAATHTCTALEALRRPSAFLIRSHCVGGARRSCARRHRLIAARRRARRSIASRPIWLASFVLAFSLALAGRSAQSNGCSHGGPRVCETRLPRSVLAARRSGAESTISARGQSRLSLKNFKNAILQSSVFNRVLAKVVY